MTRQAHAYIHSVVHELRYCHDKMLKIKHTLNMNDKETNKEHLESKQRHLNKMK